MLRADRVRNGPTFHDRAIVRELCNKEWARFCVSKPTQGGGSLGGGGGRDFFKFLVAHSFIFCPHGYGLDPSPKAWEGILFGAIPIIQHYAGDGAYTHLPVVFIDTWNAESITLRRLQSWRERLARHYENSTLRSEVLRRLMADYWWQQVTAVSERLATLPYTLLFLEWRDAPNEASSMCAGKCFNLSMFGLLLK